MRHSVWHVFSVCFIRSTHYMMSRVYVGEMSQDVSRHHVAASTSAAVAAPPVALDALMHRMEAVTETITSRSESEEFQSRKQQMDDATRRWLESVKRFAKISSKRNNNNDETATIDEAANKPKLSVPYASFLYIWDLQQTHDRVAVRRAALYLSALLLERSKDCREHLEQEDHLDQWIKMTLLDYQPTKFQEMLPYLHLEAHHWLTHLVEKGYGQFYPKIQVASQRLRQQFPHLQVIDATPSHKYTASTFTSMADWRKIRDIALEHCDEEVARVERLIDQSHQYLEILVPRLGAEPSSKAHQLGSKHSQQGIPIETQENSESCDPDDDIDWEDAGDDFDDGTRDIPLPSFEHFAAVERTLAAMESVGGLRGGELEIDFREDQQQKEEIYEFDCPIDSKTEQERVETLAKFQKCVKSLSRRHIPRLTVWLEGLANADNLVLGETSLVSLPSEVSARRNLVVNQLMALKLSVLSILKSAAKLHVGDDENEEAQGRDSDLVSSESHAYPSLRLSSPSSETKGRENILSTMRRLRKPKSRNTRSNRIQIKVRST